MGFYDRYLLPPLLDFFMSRPEVMAERPAALAEARGETLEIGFGTGLNLALYPESVTRLTLVDPADVLRRRVARRMAAARMPLEIAHVDAAQLPFDAGRFDTVVTTWTLCTIPDVGTALADIRRVLKPGGRYLFLEHGRSDDARVAARQDRWNRVHGWFAGGCHLNRPIDRLITGAGLEIERLTRFELPGAPRHLAAHYRGAALAGG